MEKEQKPLVSYLTGRDICLSAAAAANCCSFLCTASDIYVMNLEREKEKVETKRERRLLICYKKRK